MTQISIGIILNLRYQIWNPKPASVQLNFPDEDLCTFQLKTNLSIFSKKIDLDCLHHPSWSDILLTPGLNNFSHRTTGFYPLNENQTAIKGVYSMEIEVMQGQGDLNVNTSYPSYLIVAKNQSSSLIQSSLPRNWGRVIREPENLTHFLQIRITRVQFVLAPEYPRAVFQINGTLEEWNLSAEAVQITHPADCNDKLVLHAVFEPQNLFMLPDVTCLMAFTTYGFEPGLTSIDFQWSFSVYNHFESSIPDGQYTLSYSYQQVEANIHTVTIDVVHGIWTASYARIPMLWSEETMYPPPLQDNIESETSESLVKNSTSVTADTVMPLIPTDPRFSSSFVLIMSGGMLAGAVIMSGVNEIYGLLNQRSSVHWKKNHQVKQPEHGTKKGMGQTPHKAVLQKIEKLRFDFETQNDAEL